MSPVASFVRRLGAGLLFCLLVGGFGGLLRAQDLSRESCACLETAAFQEADPPRLSVGPLEAPPLRAGAGAPPESRPRNPSFSAYLDLRPAAPGASPQTTPAWIEALEFLPTMKFSRAEGPVPTGVSRPRGSVFRIRLQKPASALEQLQARVFFEDLADGARPQVTLWNEVGEKLATASLGQNLGLSSSESLTLPTHGVDYLEIEAEGDGSQIRGIFLGWLEAAEVLQPRDFPSKETVRQPFQNLPPSHKARQDSYLYGVVTAGLQTGKAVVLKPTENPSVTFQFPLERQPLMAVVTYEVLGAAVASPPGLTINGHAQGLSTLQLPDLADPGFQGVSREADPRLAFRYTGWLHAQKIIPGELLVAGLNNLSLGLSDATTKVAVRSVSIQLKYDWENLDCVLAPAPVSDATP